MPTQPVVTFSTGTIILRAFFVLKIFAGRNTNLTLEFFYKIEIVIETYRFADFG